MTFTEQLDEVRSEWEFERLQREHADCCPGAILCEGRWINVLYPVLSKDGATFHELYRPFQRGDPA
jgi:hypothetical protein